MNHGIEAMEAMGGTPVLESKWWMAIYKDHHHDQKVMMNMNVTDLLELMDMDLEIMALMETGKMTIMIMAVHLSWIKTGGHVQRNRIRLCSNRIQPSRISDHGKLVCTPKYALPVVSARLVWDGFKSHHRMLPLMKIRNNPMAHIHSISSSLTH